MSQELPISGSSELSPSPGGQVSQSNYFGPPVVGKPSRFGGYELLGEIARGGMGIVYKARQLKLKRIVALKMILSGHLATEGELERFRTEAEAAAQLDHPNIVPIYEVGDHEGRPYFSMRLIEGGNLASQLDRFKTDTKSAAKLMGSVARAIHHAHERVILHRDLKPSNILVDLDGEPHVTDFGLARLMERDSNVTLTGSAVGTPNYMSPEQAMGKTKQLTIASDIFSLGAIFYQMLTGQTPFGGETPFATVKRVIESDPAKPTALNRDLDRDLEVVCLKCLEKQPHRRYETAKALADDLERWLNHEPIKARPVSTPERLVKWVKRRPAVAGLSGLAAAGFAALALVIFHNQQTLKGSLADALIPEAIALAQDGRFLEAKARFQESRRLSLSLKKPTLAADLGLMEMSGFSPAPLLILKGHEGKVTCVAAGLTEHSIVSGGEDGTLRIWSYPKGRQEAIIQAHPGGVRSLAVSTNLQLIVSAGADDKLNIWDARTSSPVLVKTIPAHGISALSIQPNSNLLATVQGDRMLRFWSLPGGEPAGAITTGQSQITSLAFSPDGTSVALGGQTSRLELWDLKTPAGKAHFEATTNCLNLVFSPDGQQLIMGGPGLDLEQRTSDRRDSVRGQLLRSIRTASPITAIVLDKRGTRPIVAGADGNIGMWELLSERLDPLNVLSGHKGLVTSLARLGGHLLLSAGEDGTVRIWSADPLLGDRALGGYSNSVSSVRFSQNGSLILSAGWGGHLRLSDAATSFLLADYQGHSGIVLDAALSSDQKKIASTGEDGTVRLWDYTRTEVSEILYTTNHEMRCVAFTPDSRFVIAGDGRVPLQAESVASDRRLWSKIHIFEVGTRSELTNFAAHAGGIFSLQISFDGRTMVSGGGDGKIRSWDLATWRERATIEVDKGRVNSIALLRDGKHCISAGALRTLKLWNLKTGREERSFAGLKEEALSVAVSPDDSLVLAGMKNGDVKLWSLATGREVYSLQNLPKSKRHAVCFAPQKMVALIGSADASVRWWDVGQAMACNELEPTTEQARAILQQDPRDTTSLATLGHWYEYRQRFDTAAQLYAEARTCGGTVQSLCLARCSWMAGAFGDAYEAFEQAGNQSEAPRHYIDLCQRALAGMGELTNRAARAFPAIASRSSEHQGPIVLQPAAPFAKDIWTTSKFANDSKASGPGGGKDDDALKIGGWNDFYYSLLQFNLSGLPTNAASAVLHLFCLNIAGNGTPIFIDRITEAWDWKTSGTGRDSDRLWWANRPAALQWRAAELVSPVQGQWYTIDITSLYNSWQNGGLPNYGIQFRPKFYTNNNFVNFCSSDYQEDPSLRPKLVITAAK